MNLDFTPDQQAFREVLDGFFATHSTTAVVRAAEPTGFDARLWTKVVELGLPTLLVPAESGGGGAGNVEAAIAAEYAGRYLAPVPLIETCVATDLLWSLRPHLDARVRATVDKVIAGDLLATLAVRPPADGIASLVPGGAVADILVARADRLLLLRADMARGATAPPVPNLGSMPIADWTLAGAQVLVPSDDGVAADSFGRARASWQALTAAALAGLGFRALELGLDYVSRRTAFGTLLASFQTIQHRFADDVTALEGARLLAYEAAWALDTRVEQAAELAAAAFLFASDAAFTAASDALHFHGGYGCTLDYDIQLYFRRAKAWPLLAGDPRHEYVDLAHRMFARDEV
jgi:alkylation response protein AidB-like acyl-CoA dehydrogenase